MSTIPSSAMPHAWTQEDETTARSEPAPLPTWVKVGGAAILGYLTLRVLR